MSKILSAAQGSENAAASREAVARGYGEVGFPMDKAESFEFGGTIATAKETLLYEKNGVGYSWGGALPKVVPAGSAPSTTGGIGPTAWIDQSTKLLRQQLTSISGNLTPAANWSDVPSFSDPELGGPDGPMNAQAKALAARSQFLRNTAVLCYASVPDMIVGNPVVAQVGDRCSTGDTEWQRIGMVGTIADFIFLSGEWTLRPSGNAATDTALLKMAFAVEDASIRFKDGIPFLFNNADGSKLSFQNGSTYSAKKNGFINPTDGSKPFIHTVGKSRFTICGLRSYGATESMVVSQGQKLWLFEDCFDFELTKYEASRSGWDGVYFRRCRDFEATKGKSDYNKSSGHVFEDCYSYLYKPRTSSKNGRNSVDESYAGLPTGWAGGHIGRGFTVLSTGVKRDQEYSKIIGGRYIKNTEYNIRVFAQGSTSNPGVQNLTIQDFYAEDGGAPAGTYGSVVVAADKGADVLINTDLGNQSSGLFIRNYDVKRTLPFGSPVSISGDDNESVSGTVRILGAAFGVLSAYTLFQFSNGRLSFNKSYGARRHIVIATDTSNVDISWETAKDCKQFMQGYPLGDDNSIVNNKAFYDSTTTAVSGDDGITVVGNGIVSDNQFHGFHRSVTYNSGTCFLERNKSFESVDVAFRDNGVTSATLYQKDNDWDGQNPFERSAVVYASKTPRAGSIEFGYTIPTQGYYVKGAIVIDTQQDSVVNGKRLLGWKRLVTGTAHGLNTDWEEIWYSITA